MLKNYIKVTFRNMVRNKLFTIINISGLSVSIACCLLLFLYVSDQLSFDQQHGDRVYRLTSLLSQNNGTEFNAASSSIPVAPAIEAEIPEIELASRLISSGMMGGKDMISYGTESYYVEGGAVADSSIFNVLKYDLILGNHRAPIAHSNAVVLEKEWATKLFGDDIPIGKLIKISTMMGVDEFEVTGIYDKSTYRTHLNPSFIISTTNGSWNSFFAGLATQWVGNNMVYTYVKLAPGADISAVEDKIDQIFQKNGAEEMKAMGVNKVMSLHPVSDIHTTTGYMVEASDVISKSFINVLLGIGVLILVLACVNYINLSTAQAGNRALEVGVRKVMGITRRGLITQFLGESFVIVLLSLGFSILLAELSLPLFNQLVDHPVEFTMDNIGLVAQFMLAFLVITAFVAGIYPSLYLASFKPTAVLKGRNKDKGGVALLRKVLVTFQFIISIVLISAILVISEQVSFIKNKDLGFTASSRIVVPLTTTDSQDKFDLLKQKFQSISSVKQVSGSVVTPGMPIVNDLLVYRKGQTMDDAIHIFNNDVDEDYISTLEMQLLEGRKFTTLDLVDTVTNKIIVNREATKQLGFELETAIGEFVYFDWRGTTHEFKIVGVIEDINQFSLHESIEPIMLSLRDGGFPNLIIEADLENYSETVASLNQIWKELAPEVPFEAYALNDHLVKQYESDFKTFNLIKYFAIISVFISCMGLYALSMFVAERRFKEIGVRKALGAEIKDIIVLVSKDLSLLVIIAFILSIPISIYGMNIWLETFAYRITPGLDTYLIAGIASILIGWLTISYQSIRAAKTNPVNVLKDE